MYIPIENVEVRSSSSKKGKKYIRGRARIKPGKQYKYSFVMDEQGYPIRSLKDVFSENSWSKIKRKILAKDVFVDQLHKTIADKKVNIYLNQIARETGKDISGLKKEIQQWMKLSEMPLFKMEDAQLEDDSVVLEMSMNPYFRDIDSDHAAYYDAVSNSIDDGYLNSMSLNFSPTKIVDYITPTGQTLKMIDDLDVYGISLVQNAGHEEMQDVLEVSVRAAQSVIENNEVKGMTEEDQEKIKNKVKTELKEEDLKKQIEDLKRQNSEKENLLKEKDEANREAEKQALIEEKTRLEADLEDKKNQLESQSIPSKGLVPQPPQSNREVRDEVRDVLKSVEEEGHLGKAIHLQHEYNAHKTLPPETLQLMKGGKSDIHLTPQK